MPFTVLYVCTGNVCRSPMAELLLRAWADPRADLAVHSAGVHALVGQPMDRGSASALGELGVDPTQHRARQFEPWMAVDADLILTAERAHRDRVMTEVPSAFKRTFTINEFVRLAPYVESRVHAGVAEAAANRGASGYVPGDDDDLPDPYQQTTKHAKSIAQQVTESARITLEMLGFAANLIGKRRPLP